MEQMPFPSQPELATTTSFETPAAIGQDWRSALPRLMGGLATLRELQMTDAPALFAALSDDQVSRFISAPPATVEGFYQFISWAIRKRQAGLCACYAVVPHGSETPVGLFQIRSLDPAFDNAEWGFALDQEWWGTGLFMDAARQVVDFAFSALPVHRLEARAVLVNSRGNGALHKLGAVQEGLLRQSFRRNGERFDQALWTILRNEWLQAKVTWGSPIVH